MSTYHFVFRMDLREGRKIFRFVVTYILSVPTIRTVTKNISLRHNDITIFIIDITNYLKFIMFYLHLVRSLYRLPCTNERES